MKCEQEIRICVEAGEHQPPCRCWREAGHEGHCLSRVTMESTR
ncbi:hypothetical protein SEA_DANIELLEIGNACE_7 [Arthrobacter phage DanielleIgnace]|nr:hypothetical protein SEA_DANIELLEIGNACE_7 [Arthrobacter phage DanielleIgnace]